MLNTYLDKALTMASSLPYQRGRQRVGAVVVDKKGRVLAARTNSYSKTHPVMKSLSVCQGFPDKQYLHAEVAAIIAAQKVGIPYKIYIARASKKGLHLPSHPCTVCSQAIAMAGIKHIIYV